MTRGFILIAAVIAFIVGCRPSDTVPMSDAGTLRSDWGVILPAAQQTALLKTCSRPSPRGLTGPWMPARAEIDRLERRLASVLDTALARVILESGETRPTAADYYRQYGGFHREGLRVVYVNGLHRGIVQLRESPPWTEEPFGLCDGGVMGFGVVYEVATQLPKYLDVSFVLYDRDPACHTAPTFKLWFGGRRPTWIAS